MQIVILLQAKIKLASFLRCISDLLVKKLDYHGDLC
jgi:hypothetical protein